MKRNTFLLLGLVCLSALVALGFVFNNVHEGLHIGDKAPSIDMKLKSVSDNTVTLNDIKDENGLLVIFSCNDCPFVIGRGDKEGWEGRYNEISDMASDSKVGMVLVNSNEAKRPGIDSMDEMKKRASEQGYTCEYVLDQDSKLADAFGAKTTPHVYLFNKGLELVYVGAIDDNVNSSSGVKETYLKNALDAMSKGEKIDPNSTRNLGCSIKRVKT